MTRRIFLLSLAALVILPLAVSGCKAKVENAAQEQDEDAPFVVMPGEETQAPPEPAESTDETIPPGPSWDSSSNPGPATVPQAAFDRNKEIQVALKNAGLYTGAIDGKIGPKTKRAIEEFQGKNGLKVDGKVWSKTWAELEKHLNKT